MTGTPGEAASATEITLGVRDRRCMIVTATDKLPCRIELRDMLRRSDGGMLEYFAVRGVDPERVIAAADEAPGIEEARILRRDEDGGLVEATVTGLCMASTLADSRAVPTSLEAEDGEARVVAVVPSDEDPQRVVEGFRKTHPPSELLARRPVDVEEATLSRRSVREHVMADLTDRQREILKRAFAHGYFETPRAATAQAVADELGIAQSTFSEHVREAQNRLMQRLLADAIRDPDGLDRDRTR